MSSALILRTVSSMGCLLAGFFSLRTTVRNQGKPWVPWEGRGAESDYRRSRRDCAPPNSQSIQSSLSPAALRQLGLAGGRRTEVGALRCARVPCIIRRPSGPLPLPTTREFHTSDDPGRSFRRRSGDSMPARPTTPSRATTISPPTHRAQSQGRPRRQAGLHRPRGPGPTASSPSG